MKDFFQKIHKFKSQIEKRNAKDVYTFPKNSSLSRKKEHEIISLAPLIHELYEKTNCDLVVDVGTGLVGF